MHAHCRYPRAYRPPPHCSDGNEFVWMGESGVASWGFTAGVDATAGMQPWGTRFVNNLCHEIGHYEKQVSCYFAATTALATISNNIMYNMPRAAVKCVPVLP